MPTFCDHSVYSCRALVIPASNACCSPMHIVSCLLIYYAHSLKVNVLLTGQLWYIYKITGTLVSQSLAAHRNKKQLDFLLENYNTTSKLQAASVITIYNLQHFDIFQRLTVNNKACSKWGSGPVCVCECVCVSVCARMCECVCECVF